MQVANLFDAEIKFRMETRSSHSSDFLGPSNVFVYTILQGLLTVLAMKEAVSIVRFIVKGGKSELPVNRIILWHMVENWEDLFKTFRHIFYPKTMHIIDSAHVSSSVRLNRKAFMRFFASLCIYLLILMIDIGLVVGSLPRREYIAAENCYGLSWDNSGTIPILNGTRLLSDSTTRIVKLSHPSDETEFRMFPIISLEVSSLRHFSSAQLPVYQGKLITCYIRNRKKIECEVFCDQQLYRYSLAFNLALDNSLYSIPTNNFSVHDNTINQLKDYTASIEEQLGIKVTNMSAESTDERFLEIWTDKIAPARVKLRNKFSTLEMLTHEAVATIFFGSIRIYTTSFGYQFHHDPMGPKGHSLSAQSWVAVSQRPHLVFTTTLVLYIFSQAISIMLQTRLRNYPVSPELNAILELAGVKWTENVTNVEVKDLPVLYSVKSNNKDPSEDLLSGVVRHVGYMPAREIERLRELRKIMRGSLHATDVFDEYGLVSKAEFESLMKPG